MANAALTLSVAEINSIVNVNVRGTGFLVVWLLWLYRGFWRLFLRSHNFIDVSGQTLNLIRCSYHLKVQYTMYSPVSEVKNNGLKILFHRLVIHSRRLKYALKGPFLLLSHKAQLFCFWTKHCLQVVDKRVWLTCNSFEGKILILERLDGADRIQSSPIADWSDNLWSTKRQHSYYFLRPYVCNPL